MSESCIFSLLSPIRTMPLHAIRRRALRVEVFVGDCCFRISGGEVPVTIADVR